MYEQNVQSSAIWRITFDYTGNILYVVFRSNLKKQYVFVCQTDVRNELSQSNSIGKCIARMRKEKLIFSKN